jgi:aminopeptidase C
MSALSYQPIAIAINTPDCFMSYESGVFRETTSCNCAEIGSDGYPVITHAVNLVGYSVNSATQGCAGHWIVQNSWGTTWGEKGYFRLCIPLNIS